MTCLPACLSVRPSVRPSIHCAVCFTDLANGCAHSFLSQTGRFALHQHQSHARAHSHAQALDEILHDRKTLNDQVLSSLQSAAEPWGIRILRYEITEVLPDREIQVA